jgi:hypothetical protein
MMTGKTEVLGGKICPNVTVSNTNPTQTGLKLNPGLCNNKPPFNRLIHDAATL